MIYFLTWCLLTAGQGPSQNALTVKWQSHDHEPHKRGCHPSRVTCHHPVGVNGPHSYKNVIVCKPELSSDLQPVVHPTFGTARGDTERYTQSRVSHGRIQETEASLVWVEATHQICRIPGCPSGPGLLTQLSRIPLHCFALCLAAVLSKCPCCCYVRVLLTKDKPKWARSVLPWSLSLRDKQTPRLSRQAGAGQAPSFLHPQCACSLPGQAPPRGQGDISIPVLRRQWSGEGSSSSHASMTTC